MNIFLIGHLLVVAFSAKLTLYSPHSNPASIPLLKSHPFSCELVYFKVHDNRLEVIVEDIGVEKGDGTLTL